MESIGRGVLDTPARVKKYRPHPEELAKQASRRMATTYGHATILRDARKGALLQDEVGEIIANTFAEYDGPYLMIAQSTR
jgi:hypothetical protein